MRRVISEISMSLDGFVTGPNVRVGNGMGDGGDRLHDWKFDAKTEADDAIVDEIYASTGAVLIGKRMFDVGFEPWGDSAHRVGLRLIRVDLDEIEAKIIHTVPTVNRQS